MRFAFSTTGPAAYEEAEAMPRKSKYRVARRMEATVTPARASMDGVPYQNSERKEIALLLIGCIRANRLHGDRVEETVFRGFVAARSRISRMRAEGHMQNKWFSPWRQEDTNGAVNGAPEPINNKLEEEPHEARAAGNSGGNGFAGSPSELQAFEEIYRAAGIKGPRLGYSIGKVIEMLQSEHIRNLATETKRASLLMALEAAGVQVDEVLQDATLRQRAINSYEAIQRKHLEEYEARKTQENCAIQAEMERVSAEYAARISNNLEEISREKDSFRKWQLKKQTEAQRIAEAVALCVTQSGPKVASDTMSAFRELASAIDPAFVNRG